MAGTSPERRAQDEHLELCPQSGVAALLGCPANPACIPDPQTPTSHAAIREVEGASKKRSSLDSLDHEPYNPESPSKHSGEDLF